MVAISGGTAGNDTMTGASTADLFEALAGDDVLNDLLGGNDTLDGGEGADTMTGGDGNDIYIVDDTGDVVTETNAATTQLDTIQTGLATFSLDTIANVENLKFTTVGFDFTGTGNGLLNVITGNTGNDTLDGAGGKDTLVGGAGNDTYIVDLVAPPANITVNGILQDIITESASAGNDTIELRGSGSTTVAHTLSLSLANQNVENIDASATGNTLLNLNGSSAGNVLTGNNANNILNGLAGADTMIGGTGNDTYVVDNADDVVTESAAAGTDTIQSSVNFNLSTVANIEKLVLTGSGALTATGAAGNDHITGNSGANTIIGGAGVDTMIGGEGNDTYYVDNASDVVTETSTSATQIDTIITTFSYVLAATSYVENLTLVDLATTATGNARNNALTGNELNNTLTGGAGNDTLDGGTGTDRLVGGTGSDTYYVNDATDVIVEVNNVVAGINSGGKDTVIASYNYTLADGTTAALTQLENLTLAGVATTGAGNKLGNILRANDLGNSLDGKAGNDTLYGGDGTDTLIGGTGSDVYFVDSTDDIVTEGTGNVGDADTVNTAVTYTLAANIEKLILTGTGDIEGTGNDSNNTITGNSGANALNGGIGNDTITGGNGNDTLTGGAGGDNLSGGNQDDTYHVNLKVVAGVASLQDVVIEGSGASAGNDTIIIDNTSANVNVNNIVLAANVENLDASASGSSKLNFTGNASNNSIIGNDFTNKLNGGTATANGNDTLDGGLGNDTLTGGSGSDVFVFSSTLGATNVDTITDFVVADQIHLDSAIFDALSAGALSGSDFVSGAGAVAGLDSTDRIIYNTTTGDLYYDADGNGGVAAVKFATLGTTTHPTMTASEFTIV